MDNKGFTLIEILVSLVILGLAVTIVTFSFSKLNSSQTLKQSAEIVVSVLDEAKSLTLSSKEASQYGVYFEASRITLFKGGVYSSSDPSNVITSLSGLVGIRNISLFAGGSSIIFDRLTGETDNFGTMEIFLEGSPDDFITVTVSSTGVIESD